MDLYKRLTAKAKKKQKTIILPESYDERVIETAKIILKKHLAKIILIDTGKGIRIPENRNLDIIDINFSRQFVNEYAKIKKKKNPRYPFQQAEADLKDPLTFSCMLLKNKFADAIVAGSVYETSAVIRNALAIIGLSKNNKTVSSFFLFTFPKGHFLQNKVLSYADCGVLPNPTAGQLSDIAIQTAMNHKKLTGTSPKVAFLSFSTKGSAKDDSLNKVIKAFELTKKRVPKLVCDGELQFDAAFVLDAARRKNPKGRIRGDANVFIFPDLNSGNIAYKITERIGGATATGPIVQGLAKPVMDLSRGCSVSDIINMVIVTSVL
ncbi:MAG TPA: phosphate acyltransferase [Ignavibacteria bacterium]